MFMVASSVVTTIMILNYHHRKHETHEMPPWVSLLFLQYLPWLLRMSRPGKKLTRKTILLQRKMKELDKSGNISSSVLVNLLDMQDNSGWKSPQTARPDSADVTLKRSD